MAIVTRTGFPLTIESEGLRVPQSYVGLSFNGEISSSDLNIGSAVAYATEKGKEYGTIGVPTSLPEEAAIRIEAQGKHNTNSYMLTRTPLFHFRKTKGGPLYLAASDAATPEKNILLSKSADAANGFRNGNIWTQDRNGLVDLMLADAKEEGRIARMPESRQPYTRSLSGGAKSDAAHDPVFRALFGNTQEAYAQFLSEKGYDTLYAWFTTNPLTNLTPKQVGIRPVGLGSGDDLNVGAVSDIDDGGRARAVAPKKISEKE
jgi:hypothetical protein